ncbi:MAG TPA: exodeoxyribonuclease VII large subunit [Patescibacteria group bacterium]|nr:exodeoxyribonuclease VII large subunit [Patescibacteria group bacterium]
MRILHVSEYLALVNDVLRSELPSEEMTVEGEISDFRISQGKWVSFDLKDDGGEAVLKCFLTVWQMHVPLEDGLRARVRGCPNVYPRYGTFKFSVQEVELVGEGALRRTYELLKKKLQAEGLFEGSRKRPLPRFPERIALITSPDAAAYGDFLRVARNRWGGAEILFFPTPVQGRDAPARLVSALAFFSRMSEGERPEVVVLIRGGGALEDLHAFNDESVARAVFQSLIPVVCGVGHERDESLCDFVADVRASTPSNAAERLFPSRVDVAREVTSIVRFMEDQLTSSAAERHRLIADAARTMTFALERNRGRFEISVRWLNERTSSWCQRWDERLRQQERVLGSVDPKRVLARGYGIVTDGRRVVTDASTLASGREVTVQLARGSFEAEVIRVNGRGRQKLL